MSKRTRATILLAAAAAALAILATAAPARVTNAANTVLLGYAPYQEASGGRFGGKVGSAETEKYPQFTISLVSVPAGSYVAKIKKAKLPASLQTKPGKKHAIYCKAAQSKPVIVP